MSEIKKSRFQPVAVVGRGCILPGCRTVDDLWQIIAEGRVETSSASQDDWHVNQARLLSDRAGVYELDKMWSNHGGYVRGFADHFDASQFQLEEKLIEQLDPVFLWSLEAARQALAESRSAGVLERTGVVLGNLSYPTRAHSRFAEEVWLQQMSGKGQVECAPENRFMSGLPAMLVARGLGLGGSTLALDAACASSLYAIKIACDRLQDGKSDLMLAGGVNAADPLFIHMGFCALNALSKSGTSRPFHQKADGLVPSEGAVVLALKRLDDARADGDEIYGVIRGVGLSNDGRSGGFLSPSTSGQISCLKQAYEMADIDPAKVQFVECHATGTETGDAAEIESLKAVFSGADQLPLGSLKGNLGHLITASGAAGLLKILLSFEHKTIPGTPNATPTLDAVAAGGFQVPKDASEWHSDGPRLAAISSFGFGGNNAHLIIQEDSDEIEVTGDGDEKAGTEFAIVSIALRTEKDANADAFGQRIAGVPADVFPYDNSKVSLSAKSLAFPPNDLKEALGQQLILLELLPQVESAIAQTESDRTGIFIGMQTDSEVCRYGLRWRLEDLHPEGAKIDFDSEIASSPNAASVIGKMPNVPANRLSNQLDISGPGYTVSREELSGDGALEIAMTAIRRGELDAAIVGAVDLASEQVHSAAISTFTALSTSDAAVLMVIKSTERARQDGDQILALITPVDGSSLEAQKESDSYKPDSSAHAAQGLMNLAAGIQLLRAGLAPGSERGNGIQQNSITIHNRSVFGESSSWMLQRAEGAKAFAASDRPLLEVYGASDRKSLVANLETGVPGGDGPCRVALVGREDDLERLRQRAVSAVSAKSDLSSWSIDGVSFSEGPIEGEIASVFTGAASAYPGMGRELFRGLPGIASDLANEIPLAASAMTVAFDPADERHRKPSFQLAGSSYLCQLHAKITMELLKLEPDVALGLSSGETNAMFAFGVWRDMDSLLSDIDGSELYSSALAEDFLSVRQVWDLADDESVDWQNYRVLAPAEEVRRAIEDEDFAYLTIVQSERDTVIGGKQSACEAVLKRLGNPETISLGHDLAVHCPVVEPFEPSWRKLHTRPTKVPAGIRFYSNFLGGAYKISKKKVADALTGQALQTIDFPPIIEAAWNDGVRIFIEHGPRNSLTAAIGEILGEREHLAVSLDHSAVPSMTQLYRAVAALWCAGVEVDLSSIDMAEAQTPAPPSIQFDLRLPAIGAQAALQNGSASGVITSAYYPPVSTAGPAEGQLIPAAPALAYSISIAVAEKPAIAEEVGQVTRPAEADAEVRQVKHAAPLALVEKPVATAATSQVPEQQLLLEAHQRMLQAHQAFLATQLEGQRAFEQTMARMQSALFGGVSQAPDMPRPTSPEVVKTTEPVPSSSVKEKLKTPLPPVEEPAKKVEVKPGPSFSRQQLEVLAGGKISSVFGPLFEKQDEFSVQVRMPEPPLLLCDRVLGIEGEPGSMGTGTIWTETDVRADSWYLHRGRMPPGIFIESGQADLLLISWLGIDFHNKGTRAYRLLGCELVFHGELPRPGETLEYEIKVDGHAQQGDVRLFFFHYDCHINGEKRISVRSGQAGFFNEKELAESAGVLWEAETADFTVGVKPCEPVAVCEKQNFSRADISAYLDGDLQRCFGDEFARAHTHTRTPASPSGKYNFLGEVTHFDSAGGPAGRGYLRVVEDIHTNDWFFDGHFKNDPCMPGTLMADACLQAMAFYMSARGHSLYRDGWRFQPVRGVNYKFVCRGQVLPDSKQLVYEIFIDEEIFDNQPQLFAHVMCSVDGRKAFLCERLGLELVPDWPLSSMPELLKSVDDARPLAHIGDFPLDYRSLISCAWGKPSLAFGEGFAHYDGPLRSPRLPGPPYHFMTRIVALEGEMASMKSGGYVEALYDIPEDAWYFAENSSVTMPYCVLMEIALQPCGWLASYTLGRDYANSDLLFRNLDGKAVQHREIAPVDGELKTSSKLTSISRIGELIIENFDVTCTIGDETVFTMQTVFGFFPPDAMANQKGLPISDHERTIFDQPGNHLVDFSGRPAPYFDQSSLTLPDSKLLMVERITFLDAEGGVAGVGSIRGEKDVDLTEWFFKAHFFQDPVQPGSLGIEAMLQLMQAFMISQDMHRGFKNPRFEPILIADETEWHYRGQITPEKDLITIDFEVTELGEAEGSCWVIGEARLWGDKLKIYHAPRIGMRILEEEGGLRGHEYIAKALRLLPSQIQLDEAGLCRNVPLNSFSPEQNIDIVEALDWQRIRDYWVERSGEHYLVHDFGSALIRKFIRRFVLADPDDFEARINQPAIYLANHQLYVESFLFLSVITALTDLPVEAIAKKQHQGTWVGETYRLAEAEMVDNNPMQMLFLDREDPSDLLRILDDFSSTLADRPRSLLVHVEGTRAKQAGQLTEKISSVLVDLSTSNGIPIVPVRFAGGLPLENTGASFDFPIGFGGQDHYIGRGIEASELEALAYKERTALILDGINSLGPVGRADVPSPGDPEFAALISEPVEVERVLRAVIEDMPEPGERMQNLLQKIRSDSPAADLSPSELIMARMIGHSN
ncbi:MAG: beta-ketoacyl synthase [Gammaproteobacteria bacterium]|jgi:acyl transferase domain-containing protein/3-hydroxymyristoyl/3-hydroxydecanoyl-(acyl carrier protein) dehydratase|nr:beta-ketoacyl synthase [Gammaproteobacteria bacterium]|tara:strand:+ start:7693 stop:15300 length:7608 start_codon:yes stop_codon:yes gene_type:complete